MRTLIALLFLVPASLWGQHISASTSANDAIAKGVTASFSYEVPADNPVLLASKDDPAMAPAKVFWLWGDEPTHSKQKDYTEAKYGEAVSHTFAKPGTYAVVVIVNDAKNRNVIEESLRIKISQPFEIVQAGSGTQQ